MECMLLLEQGQSNSWASLVAHKAKNLLVMQETQVRTLGWEDPLEKEMATDSSILAWRIPWTEEPGGLQSMGWQRVSRTWLSNNKVTFIIYLMWGFPGGASGKEPACHCRRHNEMWIRSLGWEDLLEKGIATHTSNLAWRIPWTEEPIVHGAANSWTWANWVTITFSLLWWIGCPRIRVMTV